MRFVYLSDVEEFLRRAGPFIEPRLDCNVLVTVARSVQEGYYDSVSTVSALGLDPDDQVAFAALRTPPRPMLASPLDAQSALSLIPGWLDADADLPGVHSTPATARVIADAWRAHTGGRTRCRFRQLTHVLTTLSPPRRPARGELRLPRQDEHELLVSWIADFGQEVGMPAREQARLTVQSRLPHGNLMLWDDGGPVSLVGTAGPVAGVARVGPVYTPPQARGRGYATSAVARFSQILLDRGAHACMLFTDPDNLTSNKIYAEVGYRRVGEIEEHTFER